MFRISSSQVIHPRWMDPAPRCNSTGNCQGSHRHSGSLACSSLIVLRLTLSSHQNADGSTPNDETVQKNVAQWLAAHIVPVRITTP